MATFKVGQRVRVVCPGAKCDDMAGTVWRIEPNHNWPWGDIADGVPSGATAYHVDIDGTAPRRGPDLPRCWPASELAPLTDPLAEKFIESIKQLGPLKEKEIA